MNAVLRKKIVITLLAIGFVLALWGVNYPFVGIYNTNNNYLSLAAKNYLRFGFINLKSFPTYFAGKQFFPVDGYYLHHPVVVFWTEALAFLTFGVHNWVVHVPQFLFVIGTIVMLYTIARELWNKNVALWSAGLAAIFPMTTFFWKYMQFEQASMFLNLIIYYYVIHYLKKRSVRSLALIFVFTLLAGLVDWGVLYLVIPLGVYFFTTYRKHILKPFFEYLAGAGISLSLFVVGVSAVQHGVRELGGAIWARSYTAELTGLSVWPLRLILITLLRTLLYFTPAAVPALWIAYRNVRAQMKLPELTVVAFFIFGCLNLLFLPAASWGHSYFLYYFIPFFAFAGGLYFEKIEQKSVLLISWIVIIILTSIAVNFLKIQQVKKQLWKYDVAASINKTLTPYETVGVVNFAGDIFENYFLHPSQPMQAEQLTAWVNGTIYPHVLRTVYVCEGTCTTSELAIVQTFDTAGVVTTYEAGGNNAWVMTKGARQVTPVTDIVHPSTTAQVGEGNVLLKLYRFIRDTLNVGQI